MIHYYKIALLIGLLAIPFFSIVWKNQFNSAKKTVIRFTLAVLLVWAYILASRFIIVPLDISLATTQEEIQAIYGGDGAKNVFALFFGWLPGIILAFVTWLFAHSWLWFRTHCSVASVKS